MNHSLYVELFITKSKGINHFFLQYQNRNYCIFCIYLIHNMTKTAILTK